jgi:hypothetical protein
MGGLTVAVALVSDAQVGIHGATVEPGSELWELWILRPCLACSGRVLVLEIHVPDEQPCSYMSELRCTETWDSGVQDTD